jgi:hypothetical protein
MTEPETGQPGVSGAATPPAPLQPPPDDTELTEKVTEIVKAILPGFLSGGATGVPAVPAAGGKPPTLRQQESDMEGEVSKALKALAASEVKPPVKKETKTPDVQPGGPSWRHKMWGIKE